MYAKKKKSFLDNISSKKLECRVLSILKLLEHHLVSSILRRSRLWNQNVTWRHRRSRNNSCSITLGNKRESRARQSVYTGPDSGISRLVVEREIGWTASWLKRNFWRWCKWRSASWVDRSRAEHDRARWVIVIARRNTSTTGRIDNHSSLYTAKCDASLDLWLGALESYIFLLAILFKKSN